jgi:FAD/FMN-containing dehydrogenase
MRAKPTDHVRWSNWAANQSFEAQELIRPASEDELIAAVQQAVKAGRRVGCAGSGHSFSPIVQTPDVLLDIREVCGLVSSDAETHRAEALAGTTLKQLGVELWQAGLSMQNQGDVDVQTFAGAICTGTHGSGIGFGSMSSTVVGLRLVTGTGEVLEIDESDPELLLATQVSVGTLGVITSTTITGSPAYNIRESNEITPVESVLDDWGAQLDDWRHYSFFWAPTDASSDLYGLPPIPRDHCYVKMLEQVPASEEITGETSRRTGPAYLIYPDTTDDHAAWIELEYMIDPEDGRAAFLALRALMQESFPEAISPIQVRWTRGEPAFLSPHRSNGSCSLSVSGVKKNDWDRFLRAVDATLRPWNPRPHWGKMNYLDHERFLAAYPDHSRFLAIRAELDPAGLFLNDYSKAVLGL